MPGNEHEPVGMIAQVLVPASRRGLSDEIVDRLREAIVHGYFKPGLRLSETTLAETFAVSRGPVREALAQLEQEGLVVLQRHKGATVVMVSQEDIAEIYELRLALERLAMERAVCLAQPEDFAALDATVDTLKSTAQNGTLRELVDLDVHFHDLIYQAAHHLRLYSCWSSLHSQVRVFLLSYSVADADYRSSIISEHSELRDVLKARDRDRAIQLAETHLLSSYERLVPNQQQLKTNRSGASFTEKSLEV